MEAIFLTVSELAKRWRGSESLVYDLIARRRIKHVKLNPGKGAVRIPLKAIEEFEDENLIEVRSETGL